MAGQQRCSAQLKGEALVNLWAKILVGIMLCIITAIAGFITYALLTEPEILSRTNTSEEMPQPTPTQQPALPKTGQTKWQVRCYSVEGAIDCRVHQSVRSKKAGRLFVAVQDSDRSGTPVLRLQLPLNIYIPSGATIQIDSAPATQLALSSCNQTGCFAEHAITGSELAALTNGKTLGVSVRDRNRAEVRFRIPIAGFAEAYAKIK
jgi:invasion protein IalB